MKSELGISPFCRPSFLPPAHPTCGNTGGIQAFTEHSLETTQPECLKFFSATIRNSKFLGFSRDKGGTAGRKTEE